MYLTACALRLWLIVLLILALTPSILFDAVVVVYSTNRHTATLGDHPMAPYRQPHSLLALIAYRVCMYVCMMYRMGHHC